MGWELGFDTTWNRDIGYGVPALCDYPGCNKRIDRGLAYVCGADPHGGDRGCGLYFCDKHRSGEHSLCPRCLSEAEPYSPKPDVVEWIEHKLNHESWAPWRQANPELVQKLLAQLREFTNMAAEGRG